MRVFRLALVMLFVATSVFACTMQVHKARAHDHDRPDLNEWMSKLESPRSTCCSGDDAQAVDWRGKADGDCKVTSGNGNVEYAEQNAKGNYCVLVDGQWWLVPEVAVLTEGNRDGRALLWYYPTKGTDGNAIDLWIRCFLPGPGA
jgi:hypothetical protein